MKALTILVVLSSVAALGCSKSGEREEGTTPAPAPVPAPAPAPAPSAEPVPTDTKPKPPPMVEILNARIYDNVLAGGQPTDEQYGELAKAGYTTIVDFRGPGEEGGEGNAEKAAAAGLNYVAIPISIPVTIDKEAVQKFADALKDAKGPVIAHCTSGNRVGAVFGMKAHWLDGASPEQALAIAKEAGITRLESHVKSLLGLAE